MFWKRSIVLLSKSSSYHPYGKKEERTAHFLTIYKISFVNVDTNIILKAIDTRIRNVLPEHNYRDQTGCVEGRFIGETIRSIFDVMGFTAEEKIPGLMIFIDLKKALDSVKWVFLFK